MNRQRTVALLMCVGLLVLASSAVGTGCARDDVSATAQEAEKASAECMSLEKRATADMMTAALPAGAIGSVGEAEDAADGLKTLDAVDVELVQAQQQARTAQRLYVSIGEMRTSDANKQWGRAMAAWAAKSQEILDIDVKQSAKLREILNIVAANDAKKQGAFIVLAQAESNELAERRKALVNEANDLAAKAKALAGTPQ